VDVSLAGVIAMWLKLWIKIKDNVSETIAIILGTALLISALIAPGWWGERSLGVFFGVAITLAIVLILVVLDENTSLDAESFLPWTLLFVPLALAMIFRRTTHTGYTVLPRIYIPLLAPFRSVLLILAGLVLLIFISALVRSLSRGENVSVESHWGGLGGGIAGWRLSAPLVYLLVIVFLLVIASGIAWKTLLPNETTPPPSQHASPAVVATPAPAQQNR
jgi:hypothetical protein